MSESNEPRKEEIQAIGGKLIVTERKIKHHKSGELQDYLSFSNGQDVCGVFLDKNTKADLVKFLNKKPTKGNQNGTSTKS